MKSIGELTREEAYRLSAVQCELREAALRFATTDGFNMVSVLYEKARMFDLALREIGIEQYWLPPFVVDTIGIDTPREIDHDL